MTRGKSRRRGRRWSLAGETGQEQGQKKKDGQEEEQGQEQEREQK
jgi:hypothetical protein